MSQWRAGTGRDIAEGMEATFRQHGMREQDLLCRGELVRPWECEVKGESLCKAVSDSFAAYESPHYCVTAFREMDVEL